MTIERDLRALLTDAALTEIGERVYRDLAPDLESRPYITFSGEISEVPSLQGDGATQWWHRLIQVSVWQDRDAENLTLVDAVASLIDGKKPANGGTRFYVTSRQRLVEADVGLVHHALTVGVHRQLP